MTSTTPGAASSAVPEGASPERVAPLGNGLEIC